MLTISTHYEITALWQRRPRLLRRPWRTVRGHLALGLWLLSLVVASLIGTILGFAGVVGGQILEGGHIGQIMQGTAAIIVLVLSASFAVSVLLAPRGLLRRRLFAGRALAAA